MIVQLQGLSGNVDQVSVRTYNHCMLKESVQTSARRYTTTITKRGQVTLPAEVRRLLKAKYKDKVTFVIDGGQVRLSQETLTLENTYGSVKPSKRPEDFEEISQAAKDDKAEKSSSKLRQAQ